MADKYTEAQRAAAARYYQENRERILARAAHYRAENREKIRMRNARYYQENRERVIEQQTAYAKANPEIGRASTIKWRRNHLEVARERIREWNRNHPEKRREAVARRKARKRAARVDKVDYELILNRDGYICHVCGRPVTAEVLNFDHVVPLSRGGAHSTENIRVAHATCNFRKGTKLMAELNLK